MLGELFGKLAPFIALPLITRVLSPEEFAIYSLFIVSVFFSYILSSLATTSYIPIIYFKEKIKLANSISTVFYLSSIISLIAIFAVGLLLISIPSLNLYMHCMIAAIIVGYLSVYVQVKLSIYQCEKKVFSFVFLNIARNLIFLAFVVALYFFGASSSSYFIYSYLFSYLLVWPFILFKLYSSFGLDLLKFNLDGTVIRFGIPAIPNALANWAKTSFDRYIILFSLGAVQLGIYSVAYQLAFGAMVLSSSLVRAMNPELFSLLQNNGYDSKSKVHCRNYIYIYTILIAIYGLFLLLSSDLLVGKEYSGVNVFSFFILLSAFFQGLASFYTGILFFNEKVSYSMVCNFISLGLHISILALATSLALPLFYFIFASVIGSFIYYVLILYGVRKLTLN